jgi:hypothetical protein
MHTKKALTEDDLSILTADRLTNLELIEVQLLCDHLQKPKYQPTSRPVMMVVGGASTRDALLLCNLHNLLFAIPREDQRIIGCDPHETTRADFNRYNYFQGGPILGNAGDAVTWLAALTHVGATDPYAVDLTYIKYPDLIDISTWVNRFARSIEFTRSSGVVVSFVRSTESLQLDELLLMLKDTSGLKPFLYRSDIPSLDSDKPGSHSHLIIFRGEKVVRERA